ncbi:trpS [Acrasis kona]|uniref:TrpS n=1 Tax=Acrasis kona TaxID=1008807 RepID=A0AAW2YHE4_9EUKA
MSDNHQYGQFLTPGDAAPDSALPEAIQDPNTKLSSVKDNINGTAAVVLEDEKSGEKKVFEDVSTEEMTTSK